MIGLNTWNLIDILLKEKLEGLIYMPPVPTGEQLADILSKGLHKGQFKSLTCKLGMQDVFE